MKSPSPKITYIASSAGFGIFSFIVMASTRSLMYLYLLYYNKPTDDKITPISITNFYIAKSIFIAPIVESIAVVIIYDILCPTFKVPRLWYLITLAILFGLLRQHALTGIVLFTIFGYQYALFHKARGALQAYGSIVLSHMTNNALALAVESLS